MTLPPELETEDHVHPTGGYTLGKVDSRTGYEIATYTWAPPGGLETARAVVLMLHGVFGHSCFEWLTPDERNHRVLLRDSLIATLLGANVAVVAHDHPGHGRSSGLHAYVDSLDYMRDAAIDVAMSLPDSLASKRRFLIGMSMGATTCILVSQMCPELFDGVCLISPAVRPPDDMFGWYGSFLRSVNRPLGWAFPKLPVLKLPGSSDPVIRDACKRDPLVYKGAIRVRLGQEFLRVYDKINAEADNISFGRVGIFVGRNDNIVSPAGIRQFFDRIRCEDKTLYDYDNLAHEVMREQGCEKARADLVKWVSERID